jgi:hypothetical protein
MTGTRMCLRIIGLALLLWLKPAPALAACSEYMCSWWVSGEETCYFCGDTFTLPNGLEVRCYCIQSGAGAGSGIILPVMQDPNGGW